VVLTLLGQGATSAFAGSYEDTGTHWGARVIDKWSEYDVLRGNGDGTFAPDRDMSVAELATVLTRAFGYAETGEASVSSSVPTWAREDVKKAVAAGVIASEETGLALTRELAAKVLAKAFGVEPTEEAAPFADAESVSAAHKPYVSALGAAGLFKGDESGDFMPAKGFTRAEIMQVFDNAVTDIVRESETFSSKGSFIVNAPGVTLTGGVVKGDLIVGQGVGDGDVTLDGVTIEGRLILYGGGADSVRIKGNSVIPTVLANKTFGAPVRVVVEGGAASVGTISVVAESKTVVEGDVAKIEIVAPSTVTTEGEIETASVARETSVEIKGGAVGEVNVTAENVSLTVSAGATVSSLNVGGSNASIEVATGATVKEVTVATSDVTIEGAGEVATVTVTAESEGGVTIAVPSARVNNESGADVSAGGDKTIGAGTTDSTPAAPSGGGGSGGGGGGGGGGGNGVEVDRSDGKAKRADHGISVSHLAGLTLVVVEPVADEADVAGVSIKAGEENVSGIKQAGGRYRAVLYGDYGLSEITVTITTTP
jgi:hypothetical protein